jgi:hypothetical protein
MTIQDARHIRLEAEVEKHTSSEAVTKEAIAAAESDGIIFVDEIDKICTPSSYRHGSDASSEGVQRDLLPIIEGCTVSTKHGNVQVRAVHPLEVWENAWGGGVAECAGQPATGPGSSREATCFQSTPVGCGGLSDCVCVCICVCRVGARARVCV